MPSCSDPFVNSMSVIVEELTGFLREQPLASGSDDWDLVEAIRRLETRVSGLSAPDFFARGSEVRRRCLTLDRICKRLLTSWGVPHSMEEEAGWLNSFQAGRIDFDVPAEDLRRLEDIRAGLESYVAGHAQQIGSLPPPERPEARRNQFCLDRKREGWIWDDILGAQQAQAHSQGWTAFTSVSSMKQIVSKYGRDTEQPLPEDRGGRRSSARRKTG